MARSLWIFSFIVLALLCLVKAEVITLTDANFEHLTQASTGQTTGKWFVKFYAPWCGHCKRMAGTFKELAKDIETNHSDEGIVIAEVDATIHRDVGERFGVRGYPTLLYIASGKLYKYQGDRSLEHMRDFVLKDYLESEAVDIPPPQSWVSKQRKRFLKFWYKQRLLSSLSEDFDHIMRLRKNAAVVLIVLGFVLGSIVTLVLGRLFGSSSKNSKASKENKPKKE